MIKASELRQGNLLTLEGVVSVISSIQEDETIRFYKGNNKSETHGCYSLRQPYWNIEPIELTPEILTEWCGFAPVEWAEHHKVFKNCFTCSLEEYGLDILDNDFDKLEPLKYLHQVQNLYFALTGKELEIKIPCLSTSHTS